MEHGSSAVECRDSQSKEPRFEFPFATVLKLCMWALAFGPRRPGSLSCINEYLAVDSGGIMSEWSSRVIAAWLECFREKLSWCQGVKCKVL